MIKQSFMQKTFFLLLLLIGLPFPGQSQYFKNQNAYDVFGNYTRFGLQLDALVFSPAETGPAPEGTSFKSQSSLGYKAGVVYNFRVVPNFGFRIGALIGQTPAINTYFELDADRTGEDQSYTNNQGAIYSSLSFAFPLLAEYRNFSFDSFVTSLTAGIQIQRTGANVYTETYGDYYQTIVSNNGSWDMDLIFKAGVYLQFSRFMLHPNIVYKYRLQDQYTGTYTFTDLQNPDLNDYQQSYKVSGNYVGLSLELYLFSSRSQSPNKCNGNVHSKEVIKRQRAKEKEKRKKEKIKKKALKKKKKEIRKKAKEKYFN